MTGFIPEVRIRREAQTLRDRLVVSKGPVPVKALADQLGAEIVEEHLESDLSGLLHFVDETPVIVVNSRHSAERQTFTIAHELGHLVLHGRQTFVDRAFEYRRDQRAAAGTDRAEIQANMFAAELLLPREWLEQDASSEAFDMGDDEALKALAKRYGVSQSTVAFRLANLRLAR